jgi:DNA-binding GntR family transcriptional regulator
MDVSLPDMFDRTPLHERVARALRDRIVDGALAAGERVDERALCAAFGVSRTPLREALKVLAGEGLIDLLPNRGARVARLDPRDVADMFEVMASLESLAGRLAASRASDAEIDEVGRLHGAMVAAFQRRELAGYFRLNQAIHETILEAARNPVLSQTYRGLAGRIRRARYQANMTEDRWAAAVAEHETILAALRARDGERIGALLAEHLTRKMAVVNSELTRQGTHAHAAE